MEERKGKAPAEMSNWERVVKLMRADFGEGRIEGIRCWEATPPGGESRTYRTAFPNTGGPRNCPVERCLGQTAIRMAMRVHFSTRMSGIPSSFGRR